jgi:hypothetical protein
LCLLALRPTELLQIDCEIVGVGFELVLIGVVDRKRWPFFSFSLSLISDYLYFPF